jgi:hypothetical protein
MPKVPPTPPSTPTNGRPKLGLKTTIFDFHHGTDPSTYTRTVGVLFPGRSCLSQVRCFSAWIASYSEREHKSCKIKSVRDMRNDASPYLEFSPESGDAQAARSNRTLVAKRRSFHSNYSCNNFNGNEKPDSAITEGDTTVVVGDKDMITTDEESVILDGEDTVTTDVDIGDEFDEKVLQRVRISSEITQLSLLTAALRKAQQGGDAISAGQNLDRPQTSLRNGPYVAGLAEDNEGIEASKGDVSIPRLKLVKAATSDTHNIDTSPRNIRRSMLSRELTEVIRKQILLERSDKSTTARAVVNRRKIHSSEIGICVDDSLEYPTIYVW